MSGANAGDRSSGQDAPPGAPVRVDGAATPEPATRIRDAERLKFFTDAVVAIAITLLILPLLESVNEAAKETQTTTHFLSEHAGQLVSFALSFLIIASFWVGHHQLYEHVRGFTPALMWTNVAWMFTIVWLPVPTALSGRPGPPDRTQIALYMGTMFTTSLVALLATHIVLRHPDLWEQDNPPATTGYAAVIALAILFGVALLAGVAFPALSYYPLFILWLTGPVQKLLARHLRPVSARPTE